MCTRQALRLVIETGRSMGVTQVSVTRSTPLESGALAVISDFQRSRGAAAGTDREHLPVRRYSNSRTQGVPANRDMSRLKPREPCRRPDVHGPGGHVYPM